MVRSTPGRPRGGWSPRFERQCSLAAIQTAGIDERCRPTARPCPPRRAPRPRRPTAHVTFPPATVVRRHLPPRRALPSAATPPSDGSCRPAAPTPPPPRRRPPPAPAPPPPTAAAIRRRCSPLAAAAVGRHPPPGCRCHPAAPTPRPPRGRPPPAPAPPPPSAAAIRRRLSSSAAAVVGGHPPPPAAAAVRRHVPPLRELPSAATAPVSAAAVQRRPPPHRPGGGHRRRRRGPRQRPPRFAGAPSPLEDGCVPAEPGSRRPVQSSGALLSLAAAAGNSPSTGASVHRHAAVDDRRCIIRPGLAAATIPGAPLAAVRAVTSFPQISVGES